MMIAGLLAAGLGAGIWVVARALYPAPKPLHQLAAELREPRSAGPAHVGVHGRWESLAKRLAGRPTARQLADLRVIGRTPMRHALDKLGYAAIFLIMGLTAAVSLPLAGASFPMWPGLIASVTLAASGYLYPDLDLRSKASKGRRAWSRAISAYLDVVGIALAGGAGVEDAMLDAAKAGTGPQLNQLSTSLHSAQTRRRSLWWALEQLGRDLDLSTLRELAAAMELAGESGSRIRETLVAKASALRARQLTDVETEANKASETMGLAPALMAISAVLLIGYPAVANFLK